MSNAPPRLKWVFESYDPAIWFVTFNTHQRQQLLATAAVHEAFVGFAKVGEERGSAAVGRYVIMPDHVHLFVRGAPDFALSQWVRQLKRAISHAITKSPPHWQRGFFDHLLRHAESYAQKWQYVWENPARAGLIAPTEEWPWQGEIMRLEF